jgi:hypothetical protein
MAEGGGELASSEAVKANKKALTYLCALSCTLNRSPIRLSAHVRAGAFTRRLRAVPPLASSVSQASRASQAMPLPSCLCASLIFLKHFLLFPSRVCSSSSLTVP